MSLEVDIQKAVAPGRTIVRIYDTATPTARTEYVLGVCDLRLDATHPNTLHVMPRNSCIDPFHFTYDQLADTKTAVDMTQFIQIMADQGYFA